MTAITTKKEVGGTKTLQKLIAFLAVTAFLFVYVPAVLLFVLYGTFVGDALEVFVIWPAWLAHAVLPKRWEYGEPDTAAMVCLSIALYLPYIYGIMTGAFMTARMLSKRFGLSLVMSICCLAGILALILSTALFMDRDFGRNPDLREMVLDKLRPGTHVSEVRKLIPRKLLISGWRLSRVDGFSEIADSRNPKFDINMRKKVYVSTLESDPRYVLRLYAAGKQNTYVAHLLFDCNKQLFGVCFRKEMSLMYNSFEPRELPDYSDDWEPDWEDVYLPLFDDISVQRDEELIPLGERPQRWERKR